MNNNFENQYFPDYVSPPGETLLELIEGLGMTQAELAIRTGRPKKTINEIIQGKTAITPQTALQLERVLGTPAHFWNNREHQYREHLARLEEDTHLLPQTDWLQNFPLRAMINLGWVDECSSDLQQLHQLLNFFGVASPEQWHEVWQQYRVAFRKTAAFESERGAIAAWLRQGKLEAQKIDCQPFDSKIFYQYLTNKIRVLTLEPPEIFQPELKHLCANAGVAVVFVHELPKARVSGATRWLSPNKALIQLSLRYKTDDHLWFTFFHEAGHILLHGKREAFLEDDETDNEKEQEANKFATDTLIPPAKYAKFLTEKKSSYFSKEDIFEFAHKIGVAPGIIVGRLQHDGHLPFTHCNGLKRTFAWIT